MIRYVTSYPSIQKKIGGNHPLYIKTLNSQVFLLVHHLNVDSSRFMASITSSMDLRARLHPFEAPPEYPAGWISAVEHLRGKSSRPWCGVRAPGFWLEGRKVGKDGWKAYPAT